MPRLLAAISAHGYGHLAQTGPVLAALRRRLPGLELAVWCAHPRAVLERWIAPPFAHRREPCDVGMLMHDALRVDRPASLQAHRAFHARWEARVEMEARRLAADPPDLLLANVPYLPLAAAARAGVPAVALGSIHWHAIFAAYLGEDPAAGPILAQMAAAYGSARAFLRLEPGLPAPPGVPERPVGPVARRGRRRALGPAGERRVLVGLGGIPTRLPVARWPRLPGLRWLLPAEHHVARPDASSLEALGLPFIDALASADALVTKVGYGSLVEAVCNGTPVLYVPRGDWPEEGPLTAWARARGRARPVAWEALAAGRLGEALEALLAAPAPPPPAPRGAEEAAAQLAGWLLDGTAGEARPWASGGAES